MTNSYFFEQQQLECRERPLTVRRSNLREEFVKNGTPMNITEAVGELAGYRRDKAETAQVFANGSKALSHRFTDSYARRKYAQAMDAARVLERDSDRLHVVLITLRMDRINVNGEARAFVDHFRELRASNDYVLQRLRYYVGERRNIEFGRLSVIKPEDTGHAYIQHGLWVDGHVSRADLQPAIDAHIEHCPFARESAHRTDTIEIWRATPESGHSTDLVERLGSGLVGFRDKIEASDPDTRRAYRRLGATLMAANVNQWRPDNGMFQDAVKKGREDYEPDPAKDLGEYQGMRFNDDGDVIDADDLGGGGGGVNMVEVTNVDPRADPVASPP